jgi:hypothetical protein
VGASVALPGSVSHSAAGTPTSMPPYATAVAAVGRLVLVGLAVFGIITGIGLIRLKNWARVSILIWSAITVFFAGTALAFLLAIPFPLSPGGALVNPLAVEVAVALVYGIPVLIRIWWLLLFSQKSRKEQFTDALSETGESSPEARLPAAGSGDCRVFPVFAALGAGGHPLFCRATPVYVIYGRTFQCVDHRNCSLLPPPFYGSGFRRRATASELASLPEPGRRL